MARISGVDLPKSKRLEIALTSIYGVGRVLAQKICQETGLNRDLRTHELKDDDVVKLRAIIEKDFKVEGDLRRERLTAIKRLTDTGCYRGIRHRRGLPVRGQSTRQNARTRKGPKKTVANKKKAV